MASVTHGLTHDDTANVTSYVSAAFTPAAGDLLVVFVTATVTVDAGALTSSVGGLTFSKVTNYLRGSSTHSNYVFIADAAATATSQTVTFDCTSDAASGCSILVERVSGMSRFGIAAGGALKQFKVQANAGAGTPGPVFDAAALTGNVCLGHVANGANPAGMTPPSGWTEAADTGYATPTTGQESVYINSGFTGTTVTWGSSSATAFGAAILELDTTTVVKSGTASGTFDFSGSAAGVRTPKGSASGGFAFAGSSAGSRTPKGSVTGSLAWAGSSAGARSSSGAASGTLAWAGSATGRRVQQGTATGTLAWAGTAAGVRTPQGTATGTLAWAGSSAGKRTPKGATTGALAWAGSSAGGRTSVGSSTGVLDWAGSSAGLAPSPPGVKAGTVLGGWAFTGTAVGNRVPKGSVGANLFQGISTSFETDAAGWSERSNTASLVSSLLTPSAHGERSLRVSANNAGGTAGVITSGYHPVNAGSVYSFSFHAVTTLSMQAFVDWYTPTTYLTTSGVALGAPVGGSQRMTWDGLTAPVGATRMKFYLETLGMPSRGVYYIDAVQYEQAPTAGPYSTGAPGALNWAGYALGGEEVVLTQVQHILLDAGERPRYGVQITAALDGAAFVSNTNNEVGGATVTATDLNGLFTLSLIPVSRIPGASYVVSWDGERKLITVPDVGPVNLTDVEL